MPIKMIENKKQKELDLYIYGEITSEKWFEDEITPNDINEILKVDADLITAYINSPGGDVFAGVAITNMLKRHKALVKVVIDGLAASIASVIAQAGDERLIYNNGMVMIHKPWTIAAGNADDFRKLAEDLDKVGDSIKQTYLDKVAISGEKLNELMSEDTYMTAQEAKEYGFVDQIIEEKVPVAIDENGLVYNNLKIDRNKYANIYENSAKLIKNYEPELVPIDYSSYELDIAEIDLIKYELEVQ